MEGTLGPALLEEAFCGLGIKLTVVGTPFGFKIPLELGLLFDFKTAVGFFLTGLLILMPVVGPFALLIPPPRIPVWFPNSLAAPALADFAMPVVGLVSAFDPFPFFPPAAGSSVTADAFLLTCTAGVRTGTPEGLPFCLLLLDPGPGTSSTLLSRFGPFVIWTFCEVASLFSDDAGALLPPDFSNCFQYTELKPISEYQAN